MINWLKDQYQVTVAASTAIDMNGVESLAFFVKGKSSGRQKGRIRTIAQNLPEWIKPFGWAVLAQIKKMWQLIKNLLRTATLKMKSVETSEGYESRVWAGLGRARALQGELSQRNFDLIITHDITLMPLACGVKSENTKIMLDAREYYPRNFDDQPQWRRDVMPVNLYLCKEYLPRCDKIITVSDGLAQEYAREFHVDPEVVMSMPVYRNLSPVLPQNNSIRIIHHGYASFSRKLEVMIEMMDYVDERFSLDLMLLLGSGNYWDKIVSMVDSRKNVNLISPVPMDQIVPFTNQYDIGLFLCPPTNFNLTYTLPNKFFEFIQARLAIAIGPSIEMRKIVDQYDCGIVSRDFEPQTLATELNKLTVDKLMYYKNQSHAAASILNAQTTGKRVHEIVAELAS
jgi:hypothetical protein